MQSCQWCSCCNNLFWCVLTMEAHTCDVHEKLASPIQKSCIFFVSNWSSLNGTQLIVMELAWGIAHTCWVCCGRSSESGDLKCDRRILAKVGVLRWSQSLLTSLKAKTLLPQWRGLRDEELCKESGIAGCVYVHMSGLNGGNQTFEGAVAIARSALKL